MRGGVGAGAWARRGREPTLSPRDPPAFSPSKDVLNHLRSICADVRAVRGDFDDAAVKGGDVEVVSIGDFRVGLCHGHAVVPWGDASALDLLQRRLGVDILVTGHSHALSVTAAGGRLRIDPGSATGAWAPHAAAPSVPSFVLMDVTGSRAVVYMYRLPGGAGSDELKVEKLEFFKGGAGAPPA